MTSLTTQLNERSVDQLEVVRSKYQFLLIPPFRLPSDSQWGYQTVHVELNRPKEERLMNFDMLAHLLSDVEWELHAGALAPFGDWPVENREEFALIAAERLKIVREACDSGKYNAIVLLGGGEPGFQEGREICSKYGIVCTGNAHSQMHIATMLGARFSVVDVAGAHNLYYRDLIQKHRMQDRCASIRNIGLRLRRPGAEDEPDINLEEEKARRGEPSIAVDAAIEQAEAAVREDGAEVITLGCSAVFWLQPYLKAGLRERGWDIPVLEGYSASIEHAKLLVNLDVTASSISFMGDAPKRLPTKIMP